jgi:IQ domain-containing protein G
MQLPPSKSQSYIAIFEDAIDQLAVLGDIASDLSKVEGKPVSAQNLNLMNPSFEVC